MTGLTTAALLVQAAYMTGLRVVFDTNAFRPGNFELLEQSPLIGLCKTGRVIPIYGHVMLEETFRAYGIEHKREALIEHWLPYISKTVIRFCDDFLAIWHKELVQGQGLKTNIFMARKDQERLLARLPDIPLDGSWSAWHNSQQARDFENAKRAAQHATSKAIRQEIADWRKAINYQPSKHGESRFADYLDREIDYAGRQFLPALVKCKNPQAVTDMWSRNKLQYPYFTNFVVNMLYIAHHAMVQVNERIDLNAQADLNLMTHLINADAVVSNETGFLRRAFDDLWRPRGKLIFSTAEFVQLICKF